ncbi:L-ascorbate metabolism protein UlaG (beta-lactamase superfamily) [Nonlabens dokdonensis]|jgi:L-ascorbate metabolism protein UlaG (beta-lactamase superfamily)|uniref:L-ascorbate metabolism protein UlaG (Beta-lactamase superfamily) n=2 Tax=Nonlabens dokdonensis TaxID=328515 RepID=A0ABX5PW75_9FLAO|nr:MBL fold metallo-hydrolase [Nonlabens dokdonensis]AGC75257.1 putative metal-dependent hydrolase [Nonlabens dokdonensis DSW-6]PZX39005.1 L-ascorbate metabolism protein UlaG (beta-lactamase superfamily) [Nonlabens dokdonensis]
MKKLWITLMAVSLLAASCKENKEEVVEEETMTSEVVTENSEEAMNEIEIMPISHATFVMNWDGQIIYVDPVGGAASFEGMPEAEIILVTDIHGDHMNEETLKSVKTEKNFLFAPQAVSDKLSDDLKPLIVVNNGETTTRNELKITAIPMYNITEGRLDKHVKGRGNGYVLEKNGYRVYISGDTEDIPEMRSLDNIDKAFVCMNLPYTMDINQAASAVLDFTPKEVIPYHYRGTDGFQDVEKFKSMVNEKNDDIEVTLMEWYPIKG